MRYLVTNSYRLPTIVWMESLTIHFKPFDSASQRVTDVKIRYAYWGVALSTVGDLTEIEDSLRRARWLLFGALTRGSSLWIPKTDSAYAGAYPGFFC